MEKRAHSNGGRILKETRYDWRSGDADTGRRSPLSLLGQDDLHLFIAQIESGDSVPAAHASLMPDAVRQAEALLPGEIARQGEWSSCRPRPRSWSACGRT